MLIIAGIVTVMVIVAVVYFVGIPFLKGNQAQGQGLPAVTVVPASVVIIETAVETPVPSVPATVTIIERFEERYGDSYIPVYSLDQNFALGQKVTFDHLLTRPPLYIKFNLTPAVLPRQKVIDIGLSTERVINTTYPSPNTWFEVRVLDAGSGAVIDARGFNKEYSVMTKQEFMVRKPGSYRVEISGNEVKANISILTGNS